MNNILIVILLIFSSNALAHEQAEDYRYNPFQFKLPEYNLKAKSEKIKSINRQPDKYKTVEFNGYSFFVPESFVLRYEKDMSTLVVTDKDKKGMFFISTKPAEELLCGNAENEKDYCSVFNTRRDLLTKTFTLIPEDLVKKEYISKGYSWIVFYKGIHFKYVSNIKMYERDNFIFYREDTKHDAPMNKLKVIFMISSPKNDELIDIIFLVKDEKLIMDIIKSFRLENE